jgi:hypothetical protein
MLRTARKSNQQRVMPDTQSPPPRRVERLGSIGLFVGDSIIAVRLLNEARHRITSWVFGSSREHSNLMGCS